MILWLTLFRRDDSSVMPDDLCDRFRLFAKYGFLNLACLGFWQDRKHKMAWQFIACQMITAKGAQIINIRLIYARL
jgi:hypothetical protein